MPLQYSIVGNEDGSSNLTVFVPGRAPLVAHSSHPNYDKIREGVLAGDESVADLFDVAQAAASKFERLSDRVTAANGRLFLDGDEVDDSLAQQVVRFVAEGVDDWKPLVAFFENVQSNPQEHSREQLYRWLKGRDFTITNDGLIVGYKGVKKNNDGTLTSINTGKAIVDGEVHNGAIPNHIGAVVEMPRSEVQHDPAVGCHTGLHVGTYEYAKNFGQGAILEVHVNPRDVVSVPTESTSYDVTTSAKMRVCRYTVVNTIEQAYTAPVIGNDEWDDDEYDDDPELWGDGEGDEADDEYPQQSAPVVSQNLSQALVNPGDKFRDLDKRRPRTLTVKAVNVAGAVSYQTDKGTEGIIAAERLLTPYRFERL